MGRPLGMKGSFFFNETLHPPYQVCNFDQSEHFLGSNKAFAILANLEMDPLSLPRKGRQLRTMGGGHGGRRIRPRRQAGINGGYLGSYTPVSCYGYGDAPPLPSQSPSHIDEVIARRS